MFGIPLLQLFGKNGLKLLRRFCQLMSRPIIEAHYDCGYGNHLTLRGELPGLNWDKGVNMARFDKDYWIWVAPTPCQGHFKVLVNDSYYEEGHNRLLDCNQGVSYHPHFAVRE